MLGRVIRWVLLGGLVAVGGCAVGTHFAWGLFSANRPCRIQVESGLAQPVWLRLTGSFEDPSGGRQALPRMRFEGLAENGELQIAPSQRVELAVYAEPAAWTFRRLPANGRLYGMVEIESRGVEPAIHQSIPMHISVSGLKATYAPVSAAFAVWLLAIVVCYALSLWLPRPSGLLVPQDVIGQDQARSAPVSVGIPESGPSLAIAGEPVDLSNRRHQSHWAFWRRDRFYVNTCWPRPNRRVRDFAGRFCLEFTSFSATVSAVGKPIVIRRLQRTGSVKQFTVLPAKDYFRRIKERRKQPDEMSQATGVSPDMPGDQNEHQSGLASEYGVWPFLMVRRNDSRLALIAR